MKNVLGINIGLMKLDYLRKFFYIVPKVPRQVNIEATNKCNLNCKMCKRRELKIPEDGIKYDKYKKIINKLPKEVQEISFGSYGESFMHPKIYEMIKCAKSKKLKVTITTNGFMFIKQENRKKLLDTDMDVLRVSIEEIKKGANDAHPFSNKLLIALKELVKEKKISKSNMNFFFNTVVHKGNYNQIINIINYAEKIGFDCVELIHLDKKSNDVFEYLPIKKEMELYKKIKRMNFKIKITSLYDRYIGIRKYAFRNMKYCPFTYDVMHITVDGDVTPCCFGLPRYKIDNIFNKSLLDIWNSKKFKNFRKNQSKICNGCTLMKFD
jgi:MoaA/NifB/PqqE/SkfB family radical SAM enzyme